MSTGGQTILIGIDGRELEGKPTGVGNYLLNILREMEIPSHFRLQIFFKDEIPPLPECTVEPVLLRSQQRNLFWQNGILARELKKRNIKLLFTPSANSILFFDAIQTVAIHDLSYFNYPEWFRLQERMVRKFCARQAAHKAERIYTISNYVRKEIVSRFGIDEQKVLLTPIGMQERKIDPKNREILRKSYNLENSKIVLYVGSIFQRRHIPVLIEAIKSLKEEVQLIVIGENRTFPRQDLHETAKINSVDSRITFLEYAASKVVQDYYQMADAFVYLSTYEGFGIPPLEAMSYGLPVVISKTPAMDEVYADSAEFAAINPQAVSESLNRVLYDHTLREKLILAGLEQVRRSRWSDTARLILQDWEQLLASRS
jgi:glycosyltransferase involved in cell wall biosynthesis